MKVEGNAKTNANEETVATADTETDVAVNADEVADKGKYGWKSKREKGEGGWVQMGVKMWLLIQM